MIQSNSLPSGTGELSNCLSWKRFLITFKEKDTFLPFHGGSFKLAEKSGCPIIPIALNNVADIFEDHSPKIKKTKVVIEYGKPIYPNQLDKETKKNLAGYVSDQIKAMYFKNKALV